MLKNFILGKLKNTIFQKLILCLPVLVILYFEVFKKLNFPITDDWLYIPWGSHQVSPGNISDFELVAGHQQIITKYTIWLLGFAPKFYLPYVGFLNFVFAVSGYLMLIASSLKYINKKISFVYLLCFFIITFSFKPFYMYMTATGLGPMQAIFLIGSYYYLKNVYKKKFSNWCLIFVIFLSPFTTGLGMIVPMVEIIENLFVLIRKKYISKINFVRSVIAVIGLTIACAWPLMTENIDVRAKYGERGIVENIFGALSNPLGACKFIAALIGNIFTPSSRYDPYLPVFIGSLFLIFMMFFSFRKIDRNDFEDIFLNRNSILGGLCFTLLLVLNRYGGVNSEIIGATAPRYVTGCIVLIIGIVSLLIKKNYASRFFISCLALFCSLIIVSGMKTGLEWQRIRYSQISNIVECIKADSLNQKKIGLECKNLAFQLRRERTDIETFNNELDNYITLADLSNEK